MISPIRTSAGHGSPLTNKNLNLRGGPSLMGDDSGGESSPTEDSPTPACGVATATARLRLGDDESPIRKVPGQSRSLRPGPDGGVFGGGQRQRVPSSPLKFAAEQFGESTEDEDDDQQPCPPTPSISHNPGIPQPLFSVPRHVQSLESAGSSSRNVFGGAGITESRLPRLSASHPLRARSGTHVEMDRPALGGKKAVSLDRIPVTNDADEPFGPPVAMAPPATGRKLRNSHGSIGSTSSYRAHKRINSGDQHSLASSASISMSRSHGLKSGLALSLSPGLKLPEFGSSNSSISSLSTNNLTPPTVAFSPAEPPIFEDIKPLDHVYMPEPSTTVERKYKPRDSASSLDVDYNAPQGLQPPPSVMRPSTYLRRPAMPKRTSSAGDTRRNDITPGDGPSAASGWPTNGTFQFVGENGNTLNMRLGPDPNEKPSMPGTPVKKQSYGGHGHPRIGHSNSQPTLASEAFEPGMLTAGDIKRDRKSAPSAFVPPPSTKKPMAKNIPHLTLTATSPDSPTAMETDLSSPTVRLSSGHPNSGTLGPIAEAPVGRVGLLRRLSSGVGSSDGSEDEGTPTKLGGDKSALAAAQVSAATSTPTPKTNLAAAVRGSTKPNSIMPRMSLPAVAASKPHRILHHRQSHPATSTVQPDQEDIFEQRFITLENIGKGAFSTVMKVQERYGEGLYAVKKARGVFDGVRDR